MPVLLLVLLSFLSLCLSAAFEYAHHFCGRRLYGIFRIGKLRIAVLRRLISLLCRHTKLGTDIDFSDPAAHSVFKILFGQSAAAVKHQRAIQRRIEL